MEHQKSEIIIEQIRPEHTWYLRQLVLYPDKKRIEMEMPEDGNGIHFAAFLDDRMVGVISLFHEGKDYQFRKLAVLGDKQKIGIGTSLLNQVIRHAETEGGKRIWCNARVDAIGFYLKAGFVQTGKLFTKNGIDYEIMEKELTRSSDPPA